MFAHRLVAEEAPKPATDWFGDAAVSASGGMNLPAEARRHLGLTGAATVFVFGQRGRVILTPVGLADELLEFAADRAAERATTSEPPKSE